MPLPRTVIIAAQAVYRFICFFDGFREIFIFPEPCAGNEKRQPDRTAAEDKQISFAGLFRPGKEFSLYREWLIVKNPFLYAAPQGKGNGHLVSWWLTEYVRQLDLRVRQYLRTVFTLFHTHFQRKAPVHLPLGKNGLQPYFFILHFVRQFAPESQMHEIIGDIDGCSVIKFFHMILR